MNLQEAYELMPEHLQKEYSFGDIKNYIFTGLPLIPKIKAWLDTQNDRFEKTCRACSKILASRKFVLELGANNEDELDEKLNQAIDKVMSMIKQSEHEILKNLGEAVLSRNN